MEGIWKKQALPREVEGVLAIIGKDALRYLPTTAAGRNVPEWAKKEECWIGFRGIKIANEELAGALVRARADQVGSEKQPTPNTTRRGSWAELFAEIEKLRPSVWEELAAWGDDSGNLEEWQRTMCRNFLSKLERGKKPNVPECEAMLAMLDASCAKGFTP